MKTVSANFLLKNLNNLKQAFPGIIEYLDKRREQDLKTKDKWPDFIYYPRMYVHNAIRNKNLSRSLLYNSDDIYRISESTYMLYNWRRTKKIYKFSPELTKILCDQADSIDTHSMMLPIELLLKFLPHRIFFIEANIWKDNFGFMVTLDEYRHKDGTKHISLQTFDMFNEYLSAPDGKICTPDCNELSLIEGKTIGECMDHDTKLLLSNYSLDKSKFNRNDCDKRLMRALTFILYLISQNADIKTDEEQSKKYKPIQESRIKDKFREIEIMNVGFNIGREIPSNNDDIHMGYKCSSKNDQFILEWVNRDELDEKTDMIRKLESDIKALNQELFNTLRELKSIKDKYNKLQNDVQSERRELYDLRELIFNSSSVSENKTSNISIKYPYILKKKTVIIGGHVSWANNIRSKFNGAKVIDGTCLPNDDLIKYANVIWIQATNLPHSTYYKAINIAHRYNIPIRYFTYSGIVSCSEQLVKDDMGI